MEQQEVVIIVGAGVAGLMAARELAEKYRIIILEAADTAGGRILTVSNNVFLHPVDAGAEFIHGNTPLTLSLLKEADIPYHAIGGKMMRAGNGEWKEQDDMTMGWDTVMKQMQALKEDITIADFLQQYFGDARYEGIRQSVQRFAEGFDLAVIHKASLQALHAEWQHEDEEQRRIKGGYGQLAAYLLQQCKQRGCNIYNSCVVKKIRWKTNDVQVTTADGQMFYGNKIIVTIPLGIWQAEEGHNCSVSFEPAIDAYKQAARSMGYGPVIKIILQFAEPFWKKRKKDIGFVLSDQPVPTWWTQLPSEWPLLTGWLGGPQALAFKNAGEQEILAQAIVSLSVIFNVPVHELENLLTASHIANWHRNVFSLGGYSYNTLDSAKAVSLMNTPVDNTIFIAGEALYTGPYPGTVEAALASGVLVSDKLMGCSTINASSNI